jgi:hypothetical protein
VWVNFLTCEWRNVLSSRQIFTHEILWYSVQPKPNTFQFFLSEGWATLVGTRLCLIAEVASRRSVTHIGCLGQQRDTNFYSSVLKFTKEELKKKLFFKK